MYIPTQYETFWLIITTTSKCKQVFNYDLRIFSFMVVGSVVFCEQKFQW